MGKKFWKNWIEKVKEKRLLESRMKNGDWGVESKKSDIVKVKNVIGKHEQRMWLRKLIRKMDGIIEWEEFRSKELDWRDTSSHTVAKYGSRVVSKIPQTIPMVKTNMARPMNTGSRIRRFFSFSFDCKSKPEAQLIFLRISIVCVQCNLQMTHENPWKPMKTHETPWNSSLPVTCSRTK